MHTTAQALNGSKSPVTEENKKSYQENGYCIVDGVYSPDELNEIERFFEDWKESPDANFEKDGNAFAKVRFDEIDRTKNLVRALHPHRYSEKVKGWFIHPRLAASLEVLLGRPAVGAQTMYYYKPPGTGGQGMHQDNFYLLAQPAVCIGTWTPVDDADEENGCLLVVPGSHRWGYVCSGHEGKDWKVNQHGVIGHFPEEHKPVPVRVKRGQTMIFSGHLIHGSGPNRSKTRWRRTFIGHYADEATESLSKFYHPVINMRGEVVSTVAEHAGGGPCGDGVWLGSVH